MVEQRGWAEVLLAQLHQTQTGSISLPGLGTHPANTQRVNPAQLHMEQPPALGKGD